MNTNSSGDEHALEPVPETERMRVRNVVSITLGIMGAMVFLQVSGQMALQYGVGNTIIALVYATVLTGILASVFAYYAGTQGLNSTLITRACGFGHAGARVTALFYAVNFIALAAIEGSIMAHAIFAYLPLISLELVMVILTILNIILNWYGIHFLGRFQNYSLPIYLALLIAAIGFAFTRPAETGTVLPHELSITSILAVAGALNGIVALQSLLTADYARFSKDKRISRIVLIGFIPQIASFFIMGLIGIWFATRFREANPGIYLVAVLGAWGAIYTVLSQLRINVINIYSGSLSLQGFCSYFFPRANVRGIWVVVTAGLALIAMLLNILGHLGYILTFLGSFMFAWVATLIAELLVVRPLQGRADSALEFEASRIPAWGRSGLPATIVGAVIGGYCALANVSPLVTALSGFMAAAIAFSLHLLITAITSSLSNRKTVI